jgi:hypothetical protein
MEPRSRTPRSGTSIVTSPINSEHGHGYHGRNLSTVYTSVCFGSWVISCWSDWIPIHPIQLVCSRTGSPTPSLLF